MQAPLYAMAVVTGETLAAKLVVPPELELDDEEPAVILQQPGRPAELAIVREAAGAPYCAFHGS
jgi:hypothetical protein